MSFNLDLEFGNIYEKKLVDIIPNDSYIIKEGYFPYYDVEINKDNVITKYEVKADRYTYKTGNIAIEFKCNNLPSGISKTQADYYAYYVVKPYNLFELYIIPTQIIKDKINTEEYNELLNDYREITKYFLFARHYNHFRETEFHDKVLELETQLVKIHDNLLMD